MVTTLFNLPCSHEFQFVSLLSSKLYNSTLGFRVWLDFIKQLRYICNLRLILFIGIKRLNDASFNSASY